MAETPEMRALRTAIEDLSRAVREDASSRTRTSSRRTTEATPRPEPRPERESMLREGESGTEFDFDADKLGEGVKKTAEEIKEAFQGMSQQFDAFLTNMERSFGSIIEQVYQFRNVLDEARVELVKQTGGMKDAMGVYSEFSGYARGLGIGFKESAAMMGTLTQELPGFLDMTKQQSVEIAKEAALLSKLGITASDTAKLFTTLTKAFGQTTNEAKKTERGLVSFAQQLKQPPSIIMKDFMSALPKLTQFGSKMIDVFKSVEGVTKKLGISMDDMLGQMDKFDTFESAADATGKLNMLLGEASIRAEDLLATQDRPIERMEIFRKYLERMKETTGKTFEDLDAGLKKDLLQTSNLTADTLVKLGKMDKKALMDAANMAKMGKDGRMSLEETAAKAVTLQDRLEALKDKLLAAFLPLLENLGPIITSITGYIKIFTVFIGNLMKEYPNFLKIATGLASAFAAYKALDTVGIPKIFGALKDGIAGLIPFGSQLSGFILPGIGAAISGFALKYGPNAVSKFFTDDKTGGDTALKAMLGLTDEQIASLQKDLDGIKDFIYEGLKSALNFIGFDEIESANLLDDLKQVFVDMYDVVEKGFEKVKNILGSLFKGFSEGMQANQDEKDPFLRVIKSIINGLKRALDTLKAEFGSAGADGKTRGVMKEFSDTLTEFGETFKGIFRNVFGDLFGDDTGKPSFVDTLLNNNIIKNFGGEIITTIGNLFSGIGDLFTFLTNSVANPSVLTSAASTLSTVITTIFDAIKNNVSGFDIAESAAAGGFGAAAGGIGKLAGALGQLDEKTVKSFKGNVESLTSPIAQLSNASVAQINDPFIQSFNKLAEAIKAVNDQILEFSRVKGELNFVATIPADQVKHFESIVLLLERYSTALNNLNRTSQQRTEIAQLIEELGKATSEFQFSLDSERVGEIVGEKVANAIGRSFGR